MIVIGNDIISLRLFLLFLLHMLLDFDVLKY